MYRKKPKNWLKNVEFVGKIRINFIFSTSLFSQNEPNWKPMVTSKRQEIASRVFDDEYELILAIFWDLKNRGEQGEFSVECLVFN